MRSYSIFGALASTVLAAVHEKLDSVPAGWKADGKPQANQAISLEMSLTPSNFDKMISRLYEISTPSHPDYGQHMDREDLNAMIAPTADNQQAVMTWLKQSGATNIKSDGLYVDFVTTVANANKMFDTTFEYFTKDGVRKLRTTQYSIPDEVAPGVDIVTPTVYFGATTSPNLVKPYVKPAGGSPNNLHTLAVAPCADYISPGCIKELYNIGSYTAEPSYGSSLGFGSFLNQSASYQDLSDYEGFYDLPAQTFSVETIRGGVNNQSTTIANVGEANLDVQNIIGTSQPLPVREYITGGSPPSVDNIDQPTAADNQNEPYFVYYKYLLAQNNANLPNVISNSYGDVEETVPKKYATSVCNQIAQLGMRGISILESSGDLGVGAGCRSNANGNIYGAKRFEPIFPATCPYITSVGGTQSINPEVAWTNGSGGFSDYFPRPSYQNQMVNTYLNQHIAPSTLSYYQPYFNQNGRAFPDISAHSLRPDYLVVYGGSLYTSGGTSAASPVVAAIIGLLNDARFRQNKTALGFLNPMLYSTGYAALNDITQGGSVGCNGVNGQEDTPIPRGGVIPYASWNATVGWDPVTGLGTPNFGKLIKLLAPSS